MVEQPARVGVVIAACSSVTGGIPKYPQPEVEVGTDGIVGDYHAGPINKHKKRGKPEPNWRQITIVSADVIQELNERLEITLAPGAIAENFLVAGLGDLSDLVPGDRLSIGSALLEVTKQNSPCATIGVYHPDLVRELVGRRGVASIVVEPGTVRPGDPVVVLPASQASGQE